MKRFFCMSLCVLMLFSTTAFAKKKCWKRARRCAPCVPCAPEPCAYPCACPLIDVGAFWIGETHLATNCLTPAPIFLPGPNYSYGVCQTGPCTGSNCIHVSAVPSVPIQSIINAPIHHTTTPIFDSIYHECTSIPPRFLTLKINRTRPDEEITVKLFTFKVKFELIVKNYNDGLIPKGPDSILMKNPILEKPRVILVGFESTNPPGREPLYTSKSNNVREAIVEVDDTFNRTKKAIVFLAP